MAAFQRAYADLAASPSLCLAVRSDPAAALAKYNLSTRDHARLSHAVWQLGMDANCTLYRATRITALNTILPHTLGRLRLNLRDILDAYWADKPVHDVRFAHEAARFVDWLESGRQTRPEIPEGLVEFAGRELAAVTAQLAVSRS